MINQKLPKRKQVRLPFLKYNSAGSYFVTICSYERKCTFSSIDSKCQVHLTPLGESVERILKKIPQSFPEVEIACYVVMPNHVHAIIDIVVDDERNNRDLGTIIKWFKTKVVVSARECGITSDPVWQRGFYEHVIRTEKAWYAIGEYIQTNPAQWVYDEENPARWW